jgi:hypothetical protein
MSETQRKKYRALENQAAKEIAGLFNLEAGARPFGIELDFDSAEIEVGSQKNGRWTRVEVGISIIGSYRRSLLNLTGRIIRTNASTIVSAGAPFLDNVDYGLLHHRNRTVHIHTHPQSKFLAGGDIWHAVEPRTPELADKVRDHIMGLVAALDRLVPGLTPGAQQ